MDLKKHSAKLKLLANSATFALLISVGMFLYEMSESAKVTEQIVNNLMDIQKSLPTRYLGLFPEYIGNINELLNEAVEHKGDTKDSVVIFEDVVYYGVRSNAQGFCEMIDNLMKLSDKGCHITLAYYDVNGAPFKHMIRDKLISHDRLKDYKRDLNSYRERALSLKDAIDSRGADLSRRLCDEELNALVKKHFKGHLIENVKCKSLFHFVRDYELVDSFLCQHYYELTRDVELEQNSRMVKSLLKPLPQNKKAMDPSALKINKLCKELDSIKQHFMGRPQYSITYADFFNMYKSMTNVICAFLKKQTNVELIPLNEPLMMCCWMTSVGGRKRSIFAFPSKYSTDEIGFTSQDDAIAKYILTMLKGIKG